MALAALAERDDGASKGEGERGRKRERGWGERDFEGEGVPHMERGRPSERVL